MSIVAVVLLILNIYPVSVTKDFIFESKYSALKNQCQLISTSAGELETINADNLTAIINILETGELKNIVVVDKDGNTLFARNDEFFGLEEKYQWSFSEAVQRNDSFYSSYDGLSFLSIFSMPIVNAGRITGVVTVLDEDVEQGGVLHALTANILRISVIIGIVSVVLCVFFTQRLTSGIRLIVTGIGNVRDGEFNYRIDVPGKDEIAMLADEFNSLTARLQENEEIRRQFVADASHELKTPLASIQLLSDSIIQNEMTDMNMVTEFVSDIGNEARRLARTTDKLLRLTNLDNKIAPDYRREDMGIIAERQIKMLRPIADERAINIECNVEEDCIVFAARDDIAQIVINLVENAIKYNIEGGVVSVHIWKTRDTVFFSVADTGIGMPENEIPMVFDRFYRVDKARSRAAGGSGLGLSIVKSTIERYNGTVDAGLKCTGGMVFLASFPRDSEDN